MKVFYFFRKHLLPPLALLLGLLVGPLRAQHAYIANNANGTVSVIRLSDNSVVATVSVGSGPYAVAASADGSRVYVTNFFSNSVSVIQTSDNTVVATVGVGSSPGGVAVSPDGSRVYVTNGNGGTVSVIRTSDNTVIATVGVGSVPTGVAFSPDGSRVYVAVSGNLAVIRTSDNTVVATVPVGGAPFGVAVSPDGSRVYVTKQAVSNSVSVVQTSDNTVVATVPVGTTPRGVAVSPDGSRVYVVNGVSNNVSVIRTSDNTVVATVAVGSSPVGVSVNADGSRVYVTNSISNSVSVIQTADNTVVATVAVGTIPVSLGNFISNPFAYTSGPDVTTPPGGVCAGQAVGLGFGATPGLASGNTFTAELSDASGSFASPASLGTVTPGKNQVTIPAGAASGTGYRIRVVASNPAKTSSPSDAFALTGIVNAGVAGLTTPSRVCQRGNLDVAFGLGTGCPLPSDNAFTVQLSNAFGSFANPTVLGLAQPGTNPFPLPTNLPAGTGYRVRVVSSNPAQASQASQPFRVEGPSLNFTPTVSGGPVCRGTNATVAFNLPAGSCPFPPGNEFTAQLSSATGSFNNPTTLGTVLAGQSNNVPIPTSVSAGSSYRIRIVSSNPSLTSSNSAPFQVKACASRLSAEEPQLVVSPNPVSGREIRGRVSGMDNPAFSLTTPTGRSLGLSVQTDGSGEFVLMPKQPLPVGVYVLQASEGQTRLTRRVLVAE